VDKVSIQRLGRSVNDEAAYLKLPETRLQLRYPVPESPDIGRQATAVCPDRPGLAFFREETTPNDSEISGIVDVI